MVVVVMRMYLSGRVLSLACAKSWVPFPKLENDGMVAGDLAQ